MSDYIDRQKAIKAVEALPNCYNGYSDTYDKSCIIGLLEELPSAQPERKKGKWLPYLTEGLIVKCSVCGSRYDQPWRYCPNCGSYNGGEQRESN